ncbi:hypothetical protein O0G73_07310, partial [Staphylococcus delphini]|uniref:hypothetical protein n=1 Tax=Staphylococcus delphini TaxID=53344 RepID=UPI0023B2CDB8
GKASPRRQSHAFEMFKKGKQAYVNGMFKKGKQAPASDMFKKKKEHKFNQAHHFKQSSAIHFNSVQSFHYPL